MTHLLIDILRNSILITGLVTVMMMLIESIELETKNAFFTSLKKSKFGQTVFSALLGLIPGCIGGFASVSLYTGRVISFGALTAMMIASCGDEAFMLIAMRPDKAPMIFFWLFLIATGCGAMIDFAFKKLKIKDFRDRRNDIVPPAMALRQHCHGHRHQDKDGLPANDDGGSSTACGQTDLRKSRKMSIRRTVLFLGVIIFITALAIGILDHEHAGIPDAAPGSFDFLNETWMQYLFAALGLVVLAFIVFASDRFIEENLWEHIVKRHLPVIFCWTFGILLVVEFGLSHLDISRWISDNTALMILLAAAIGIIPESGPHLVFVTLYASGVVPLPVLLASCISQDGHSSLPLLAESKKSFAVAKLLNFFIALIVGYGCLLL